MEIGIQEQDFNKYEIALESLNNIASFVEKLDSDEELDTYTVNAVIGHTEQCAIDLGMEFKRDPNVVISQEGLLSSSKSAVISAAKYVRDMLVRLYEYIMKKWRSNKKGVKEAKEKAKAKAKEVGEKAKKVDEILKKAKKHADGIDDILKNSTVLGTSKKPAGMSDAQFEAALNQIATSGGDGKSKKSKDGGVNVVYGSSDHNMQIVVVDANDTAATIAALTKELDKADKADAAKAKKDSSYKDRFKARKANRAKIRVIKQDILDISLSTGVRISTYRNHKWHFAVDQHGKQVFDLEFEKPLTLEAAFDIILTKAEKNLEYLKNHDLLKGTDAFNRTYRAFLKDYSSRESMEGIEDAARGIIHEAYYNAASASVGIMGGTANMAYTRDYNGIPKVEAASTLAERKALAEKYKGTILIEEKDMSAKKVANLIKYFEKPLLAITKELNTLEKLTNVPNDLEYGEGYVTPNAKLSEADKAKYNKYYRVPSEWAIGYARAVASIVIEITDAESFMIDVLNRLADKAK